MPRIFNKDFNAPSFKKEGLKDNEIILSQEPFYTIQGEGYYSGQAAFFIRTAFCSLACSFCSLARTEITTINGKKNIEDIQAGELVLGYNEETKKIEYDEVKSCNSREVSVNEIYVIEFSNGRTLKVTSNHRFLVNDEWIEASKLKVNDFVFSEFYYTIYVKSIKKLYEDLKDESVTVYSLTMNKNKNYMTEYVLSHNCDEPTWDKTKLKYSYEQILSKMQELNTECKLIIFTGGEPALQLKESFITFFTDNGYKINIETSGSYFNEALFGLNHICISPKRLSDQAGFKLSEKTKDKYIYSKEVIKLADEIKFIIGNRFNKQLLLDFINTNFGILKHDCKIYVSPCDEYDEEINEYNMGLLKELVLENPNVFRVSLQVHKYIKVA